MAKWKEGDKKPKKKDSWGSKPKLKDTGCAMQNAMNGIAAKQREDHAKQLEMMKSVPW